MNGSVAPLYTYRSLPDLATAPDGASLKHDVLLRHGAAPVGAQHHREGFLHETPSQAFHDRHLDSIVSAIRSSVHARPPSTPSAPSARSSTYVCLSLRTFTSPRASSAASSSRSASASVSRCFFVALGGGCEKYCGRPAHAPNPGRAANLRLLRY